MLKSMTGFGRGETLAQGKRVVVEIKAVNHRYCEVVVRMPRVYFALEERIRQKVKEQVGRGRLDIYVNVISENEKSSLVKVDKDLAMAYHDSLRELGHLLNISPEITLEQISRFPGVFNLQEEEENLEEFWEALDPALQQALAALLVMRKNEGTRLEADIEQRVGKIQQAVQTITEQTPTVVTAYRTRLEARVKELLVDNLVGEDRLAAEVALFAERCNVTEELVRMGSHLEQVYATLHLREPSGRKLDFLIQELFREINTIGSKANDASISHTVVEVKSELEKIREQVQNIE